MVGPEGSNGAAQSFDLPIMSRWKGLGLFTKRRDCNRFFCGILVVDNSNEGASVCVFELPAVDIQGGCFLVAHFIARYLQGHAEGSCFCLFQHEG